MVGRPAGQLGRDGGDRGVLEAGVLRAWSDSFEVWLCNAQHVKNVPGRKTDMSDAEWLADVAAHGMVRPSFVPPPAIRELRELTRYRKTQIDARVAEIQRLEKVLQDAGIKLTSVASKVLTQSGRLMVEALIAGQRDPAALAELAKGKLRPKIPAADRGAGRALRRAPRGGRARSPRPRRLPGRQHRGVDRADRRIRTRPYEAVDGCCCEPIPGFDRLVIDTVIAETGADMTRFPSRRASGDLGRRVPRQPRVGGQATPGRCHAGQSVAARER